MEIKRQKQGLFVISLDFELYWGMIDKVTLEQYGEHIRGVRTAIPNILSLFSKYDLHATWATVGMLMYADKQSLCEALPPKNLWPTYKKQHISTYQHIETFDIGSDEATDPYHFGGSLIAKIKAAPNQEIGSHTFSHYYCIDGRANNVEAFSADCQAMQQAARLHGITPTALVFPRNQATDDALATAAHYGIVCYRGTENHFLYQPRKDDEQSLFIRALRLLDAYVTISGHHTHPLPHHTTPHKPTNVPASRFLRPYSSALRILEPLRLRRIKNAMTHAAKRGELFHLWWHPHNFGVSQEANLRMLEKIAEHYQYLQRTYKMESSTMSEAATGFGLTRDTR